MANCLEYIDSVMSVVAIPLDDLPLSTAAWQLSPAIPAGDFSPTLDHAITIGVRPATEEGILVPMRSNDGKVKDDTSDNTAGRLHTVNVMCNVDDRDAEAPDVLLALQRTPFHLLLMFRNGQSGLVAATRDSYLCQVSREDGNTSISFRIQNLNGMQLIR